jgi:hypothetical protein
MKGSEPVDEVVAEVDFVLAAVVDGDPVEATIASDLDGLGPTAGEDITMRIHTTVR